MSKERAAQLVDAGVWLRLSGDLDGARKLFERALKLDPANERAEQLLRAGPVPPEAEGTTSAETAFEPSVAPAVAPIAAPAAPDRAPSPHAPEAPAPSAAELDWGKATGFDSPRPFSMPSPRPASSPSPVASTPSATISLGVDYDFPVRSTPPIYGASSAQKAPPLSVSLDAVPPDAPPLDAVPPPVAPSPPPSLPSPPRPTDWQSAVAASNQPSLTVTLTDENAPSPSPPRSTPPLFESAPTPQASDFPSFSKSPIPIAASSNVGVPMTSAPDPVGVAWAWSNNSPAPFRDPGAREAPAPIPELPVPQPSPLTPNATSAWDNKSNPGIKLSAIVGEAKALEMLSSDSAVRHLDNPQSAKDEVKTLLRGARDLLDLDDHTGAMELIVKAQTVAPDDPDVKIMRERSEKTLLTMFESKLGKLETIPRVLLKEDEIIWLNLDHRAGFVLAQIDGTVSFDDLFAVSGMSRLDTSRILAQLIDEGVISRS